MISYDGIVSFVALFKSGSCDGPASCPGCPPAIRAPANPPAGQVHLLVRLNDINDNVMSVLCYFLAVQELFFMIFRRNKQSRRLIIVTANQSASSSCSSCLSKPYCRRLSRKGPEDSVWDRGSPSLIQLAAGTVSCLQ